MAFRNPTTSLPASAITGQITGPQIADGAVTVNKIAAGAITADKIDVNALNGQTITGALIRSAASANRVEIASTPLGGYAEIDLYTETSSDTPGNIVAFGASSGGREMAIGAPSKSGATDVPQVFLGYTSPAETASQIMLSSSTVVATGSLYADNYKVGRVSITPSAANTPTSITVSGLAMKGTGAVRAQATASTSVPGTQVTGVGCSSVTRDGLTIWVTRVNTTATSIDYLLIGE